MYIVLIRISISTKRHIKTHSHSCRNRKFYLHLSHGVNLHTDQQTYRRTDGHTDTKS